jgi:uncharacterized protein with gpF-like domain
MTVTGEERRHLQELARLYIDGWEKVMVGELQRMFRDQAASVVRKLSKKSRGAKALDLDAIFDRSTLDPQTRQTVSNVLGSLYEQVGDALFETFSVEAAFNLHDPKVTAALGNRVNKVVGINQTTEDALRATLQEGEAAGETLRKLTARVQDVFDEASDSRAVTIARTEVVGSMNEANYVAAAQADLELTKEWLATDDERTREDHLEADGQEVAMDDFFDVGGFDMLYPGDPDGPAEEVINCRCVVLYNSADGGTEVVSPADDGDVPEPDA